MTTRESVQDPAEHTKAELIAEVLALRAERDKFRREVEEAAGHAEIIAAVNHISEAFVIYDADGHLVTCNHNFRELYGYTEKEASPGVHFQELGRIDVERGNVAIGDQYGGGEGYLERKAAYRKKLEGSFIVHLKDGRWIKTTDRLLPSGGFVSIQSDITELKSTELELLQAKEKAELASMTKSEFLASMSHELRTPLNSIIGFSEVLHSGHYGALNDRQREYIQDIVDAGRHLLDLIRDLLDLSKIEAGMYEPHFQTTDVPHVLDTVMRLVHEQAFNARLKLSTEIATDLPPIEADERLLRQILLNLLSNAVKFTPPSGRITVSLTLDKDIRITVTDSGIGIAPEDVRRVLEPFVQLHSPETSKEVGTGIGLSLSRKLVQLHGGDLELESVSGQGTTVIVSLPIERLLPQPAAGVSGEKAAPVADPG